MSANRKIAASALSVAALAAVVGMAVTFSSFTSKTDNPGNKFAAGTVVLTDNDADAALFDLAGMQPGVPRTKCLTVTYAGSLDAKVRLYATNTTSAAAKDLAPYLNVKITRGTSTLEDCSDFTAAGDGAIFDDKLSAFGADYDNGTQDPKTWVKDDAAVYQVRVEVEDVDAAQGRDAETQLTFEARDIVTG